MTPVVSGGAGLGDRSLARYSRQIVLDGFGIEGQLQLGKAKVLIVGAGGLGSPAALYLAAAGVGTVGVVDMDAVDVSNLHRQILHEDGDVGRSKTASAKERLQAQNPDVTVVEHAVRLDSSNALDIIADYDVVVNGCDNFPTRYLVNDACVLLRKPLVDASILQFYGQLTVFLPGQGCYRCLFPDPPEPGSVPGCAEGGIIGAVAGHMGTLQAVETLKLLLGIGTPLAGRLLLFDAWRGEHRQVRWERDPACAACGEGPTVVELIDYEAFCGLPPQASAAPPAMSQDQLLAKRWAKRVHAVQRRLGEPGVLCVDVRGLGERRSFHIPGTRHVPTDDWIDGTFVPEGPQEVYLFCLSGERSARLTGTLRDRGFSNVYNVHGGLLAWLNAGLPVERASGAGRKFVC